MILNVEKVLKNMLMDQLIKESGEKINDMVWVNIFGPTVPTTKVIGKKMCETVQEQKLGLMALYIKENGI